MPDAPHSAAPPTHGALEALLGQTVEDAALYAEALTHRSLARGPEAARQPEGRALRSNERLEFLGDALLGAEVAEALFREFPKTSEGTLSRLRARLVSGPALARAAGRLGIGPHLRLTANAERSGARTSPTVLADAFEALLGALYLDQGTAAARAFVRRYVLAPADLETLADAPGRNYKSQLQERVQARARPVQPTYRVAKREGPPHARRFTVEALIDGEPEGTGTAMNKKDAEQAAARQALQRLQREAATDAGREG